MNTITTTASTNASILAIDLGKYKSVACIHEPATGEFRFMTFDTSRVAWYILNPRPAVRNTATITMVAV